MKKYLYVFEHSLFDFYNYILHKDTTPNLKYFAAENQGQYYVELSNKEYKKCWDERINAWLEALKNSDQECICAILGPHFYLWVAHGFLDYARSKCPGIVLILNLDDSTTAEYLPNCRGLMDYKDCFDGVICFDPMDAERYDLLYHDILYSDVSYILDENLPITADVALVCAPYDRLQKIYDVYDYLTANSLTCNFHLAGVPQDQRRQAPGLNFHDQYISYKDALKIEAQSHCILEIVKKERLGNTPRVYEAICLNKLLISNNDAAFQEKNKFYTDNILSYNKVEDIDISWIKNKKVNYPKQIKQLLNPQEYINFIEQNIISKKVDTILSICICAYNADLTLGTMLKSIPVRDDVEVIMVNDGSTDSSKAIFEKFVKVFPKAKFLNHEKNLGIGKTRQDAQKMITGKYFVYGDADDLFLPDFNVIINKLYTKEYQNYDLITYKHIDRRVLSFFNIVAPWGKITKTDFWVNNNLDWPGVTSYEDAELVAQIIKLNPKIYYENNFIAYFYNYPNKDSICGQTKILTTEDKVEVYGSIVDDVQYSYIDFSVDFAIKYHKANAVLSENKSINESFNNRLALLLEKNKQRTIQKTASEILWDVASLCRGYYVSNYETTISIGVHLYNGYSSLEPLLTLLSEISSAEIIIVEQPGCEKKLQYLSNINNTIKRVIPKKAFDAESSVQAAQEIMTGKYFIHIDANDLILPSFRDLISILNNTDADIVTYFSADRNCKVSSNYGKVIKNAWLEQHRANFNLKDWDPLDHASIYNANILAGLQNYPNYSIKTFIADREEVLPISSKAETKFILPDAKNIIHLKDVPNFKNSIDTDIITWLNANSYSGNRPATWSKITRHIQYQVERETDQWKY